MKRAGRKKKEVIMNPVTTYLLPSELDRMEELSREVGLSVSALIRRAVKKYLESGGPWP